MNAAEYYLFASLNPGKFEEARLVFGRYGLAVTAPFEITAENYADFGLPAFPGAPPEPAETADSYLGNARLKAEVYYAWCGLPAAADDSGLEVEALDGAPGVISARFAGLHGKAQDNIDKLLGIMQNETRRRACFKSAICCRLAAKRTLVTEGVLKGEIGRVQKGTGGFGYDSVFVVDGYGKTLAELKDEGVEVKTHRILALEALCRRLI